MRARCERSGAELYARHELSRPPERQAVDIGGPAHAPMGFARACGLVAAIERDFVPRRGCCPGSQQIARLEPAYVDVVEAHGFGWREAEAKSYSVPGDELAVEALGRNGADELLNAAWDDCAAGDKETGVRVVERGDDVFLEGIVAKRFGYNQIDPVGVDHVDGMHLGDPAVEELVVAQQLAGDLGDLGRLIEVHPLGAEFCREKAEEARARSDIRDGRLALDDDPRQCRVKSRVAHTVGEQGAVVLDAHAKRNRQRAAANSSSPLPIPQPSTSANAACLPWPEERPPRLAAGSLRRCPRGVARCGLPAAGRRARAVRTIPWRSRRLRHSLPRSFRRRRTWRDRAACSRQSSTSAAPAPAAHAPRSDADAWPSGSRAKR